MTAPDPSAPHDTSHDAPPPPRRPRVLRFLLWAVADLLVLALVLAGAAWWWTGSSQSLATALAQAQRFLPADQTLVTRDVSGSLRSGGHIGWLRWSSPTLSVEVEGIDIGWELRPMLQRDLKLGEVHARTITIERTGPPSDSPMEPLQDIVLPIKVDLPFRVDALNWVGPQPLQATALAGRYRFDGEQHYLTVDGVDIADGHYSATVQLQGAAPMAIDATLEGSITTPVPGSSVAPLAIAASARIQGTLAGNAAALQVQAALQPSDTSPPARQGGTTAAPMQAQLQANIAPWAAQPLVQAQADFSAIDLARLWPQAPSTLLSGKISAGPLPDTAATPPTSTETHALAATRWQIQADVRNARPGPWDTGRLPVDQLSANALFDGTTWDIPSANLRTGPGEIALQGRWSPPSTSVSTATPAPWQLRTTVRNLSPATLHTQLAPAALSGTATAAQTGDSIQFDVALNSAAKTTAPARTVRLDSLATKGQWRGDLLTLDALRLVADQAQLQGQLKINTAQPAAQGQLALTVPGAQAQINGQMAATQGAGTVDLTVADAAKAQRWAESLPGMAGSMAGNKLQGQASLKGSWQGGWQSVQTRLASGKAPPFTASTPPTPGNSGNFTVQATLAVPQLDIQPPPPLQVTAGAPAPVPLQLRGVRAELSGHLAQASLSVQGELRSGTQALSLQTQLNGGMESVNQWRAALTQLSLQVNDTARAGPWALQLNQPTSLSLRTASADKPGLDLLATAGSARLTGPLPGTVQLAWEPLRYSQIVSGTSPNTATRHQLQTKGQLQDLPLAWVQALATSNDSLRNMGVRGNLVFGGSWDINYGDTLRATAQLTRTSGDIQVQTGDIPNPTVVTSSGASMGPAATTPGGRPMVVVPTGPTTSAGVRQAKISLDVTGTTARAQLVWDSANAGQLQADASTQLSGAPGQLEWAANAPLTGKVRANMPSIGAWSVLAPPGWRVQGTLDADAQLSGTRDAPRWSGNLAANGMSIRSVVDGVDLRDGRLRASLNGERIDITEFTLRGGTGSSTRISGFSGNRGTDDPNGGLLSGRGNLTWGGAAPASGSGIRMQFDAEAKGLRVLVRADRQLALSGTMQATLNDGQFTLRAKLKTDRAAFILPDETAPQLGSDVVVRSVTHGKAAPAPASDAGPVATPQTAKPPDIGITFNLGDDFAVQGHGVTTRLTGELDIRSTNGLANSPRVTGEIRTDRGKYRAYGQQLDIETGVVRFNGTLTNPSLDILALRPNISVRAGAQITGTAQSPRVRLYSDPIMPDAETLSWVVLGHSVANGGAEAAVLQQAALALLGRRGVSQGSIANRFGLDEVGFRAPADGESASGAVLTVGKRISQNMYVTYESSLSGVLGTLFIFYDLTRHLTLRAQTGSRSAVDLIYTVSFD